MKLIYTFALAGALALSGLAYAGDDAKKAGEGCCGGDAAAAGKDAKAGEGCCGAKGEGCCGGDKAAAGQPVSDDAKPGEVKIAQLKLEELQKLVAEKKATIVDVNPAERYQKGHVPGAKNMKFDAIAAKDLPTDKTTQLVFYCANEKCGACEKAAQKAIELGYKNVAVYRGGIAGWEGAKKAVETGNPS